MALETGQRKQWLKIVGGRQSVKEMVEDRWGKEIDGGKGGRE